MNSFIYGLLLSVIGILGIGFFWATKRATNAENKAHEAELEGKIKDVETHNKELGLSDLINEFDRELDDDDSKNNGGRS